MVPTSTVHKILRNHIYSGDFGFDGTMYHGACGRSSPASLWGQQVQTFSMGAVNLTRKAKATAANADSTTAPRRQAPAGAPPTPMNCIVAV